MASASAPFDEEPVSAFEVPRWKRLGKLNLMFRHIELVSRTEPVLIISQHKSVRP